MNRLIVPFDDCQSAFYRFVFEIPPLFENAAIYGVINADDLGAAFLNSAPLSPTITEEDYQNLGTTASCAATR